MKKTVNWLEEKQLKAVILVLSDKIASVLQTLSAQCTKEWEASPEKKKWEAVTNRAIEALDELDPHQAYRLRSDIRNSFLSRKHEYIQEKIQKHVSAGWEKVIDEGAYINRTLLDQRVEAFVLLQTSSLFSFPTATTASSFIDVAGLHDSLRRSIFDIPTA